MTQSDFETFIAALPHVQRVDNDDFGYIFFFVGDDHRLPFTTIAHADNDFDAVSNLNRPGVFRLNIGVSRQTFDNLAGGAQGQDVDYTIQDAFLPHPHYAPQNWLCILNPTDQNVAQTKKLIHEAHDLATKRMERKSQTS